MLLANTLTKIKTAREGGQVTRCHTYGEYHGTYNVAIHSFNLVNMILILRPSSRMELVQYALRHDLAERWMGDTPHPAKYLFKDLHEAYFNAEEKVGRRVGIDLPYLNGDESMFFRALDVLEVYLWAVDQGHMGNKMVDDMLGSCEDYFREENKKGNIPADVFEIYSNYLGGRLPELGRLFPDGIY